MNLTPNFFYIAKREDYRRSGKNSLAFFESRLPIGIRDVKIAYMDRVIKFFAEGKCILIVFRGGASNIYLMENDKITDSVLSEKESEILKLEKEFSEMNFIDSLATDELALSSLKKYEEVKKMLPFMNKEMFFLFAESGLSLDEFLHKYLTADLCALENPKTLESQLLPDFSVGAIHSDAKYFHDNFEAINYFVRKKYANSAIRNKRKAAEHFIDAELQYLSDKLEKLKSRINKGSKEDEYSAIANLILINLHKIKTGIDFIFLEDSYDENRQKKVVLKKNLSPTQNAEYYFKKAKSEKIELAASKENFNSAETRYNKLLLLKNKFEKIEGSSELQIFLKENPNLIKDVKQKDLRSEFRFKEYLIDGKYKIYVGKDSKNNDELTTKFAKQNDLWFHARGVSGSHLIIRNDNSKEPIPKNIIKKAAALAAYHSKAKTSSLAPVAYTFKKYVSKKKGSPAGTVYLQKEEVVLVKPEIPAGAEYISKTDEDF